MLLHLGLGFASVSGNNKDILLVVGLIISAILVREKIKETAWVYMVVNPLRTVVPYMRHGKM